MNKKILLGALLAIGLVVGLYLANRYWIAPVTHPSAKSGGPHPLAPNFSLTDISGQKLELANYKGKVVLLDFWATWCGPCRTEIPGFVELQKKYRDKGFVVIGISMDDGPEPVRDFYREYKMNYPVALGDDKLGGLYGGIFGLPTSFVIGRDGRIYSKHVGATEVSQFEAEIKELLEGQETAEVKEFKPAGLATEDKIELGDPAEVNSEIPGLNLTKLTDEQKEEFKKVLEGQNCTCPCKMNLLRCRQNDRSCGVSLRMAREELDKFLKTKGEDSAARAAS
ncbi:MAG TPA: TlpA disulfide reductase family protein [Terriglobia bacterium]|nr:TlpA disulfide reductase family protein [Terriglobia bacterium]